jgi:hypothetical protein
MAAAYVAWRLAATKGIETGKQLRIVMGQFAFHIIY